jgi:hypothetical protein
MPKVMSLYLDDSGTRNPDRKLPEKYMFRDWFTLGGFITKEEDEGAIETQHADFCTKWKIDYPLHSYDIDQRQKTLRGWLRSTSAITFNSCAICRECCSPFR